MSPKAHSNIIISPERAKTCARRLKDLLKKQHGINLKLTEAQNMIASIADVSGGWHGLAKLPEVDPYEVMKGKKVPLGVLKEHDIYLEAVPTILEYAEVFTEDYTSRNGVFYLRRDSDITQDNADIAFLYEIVDDEQFPKRGTKEELAAYVMMRAGESSPFNMAFQKAWESYETWLESEDDSNLTILQKRILKARMNANRNGFPVQNNKLFWPYHIEKAKDDTWVFRNRDYGLTGLYREPRMDSEEWKAKKNSIKGFKIREMSEIEAAEIFQGSHHDDAMFFFNDSCPPWGSEELGASYLVRLNWFLERIVIEG